jgi:hypothetical protein
MLNPNQELDTKLDSNPHKLTKIYRIGTISAQMDGYTEILSFPNRRNPKLSLELFFF